MKKLFTLFLLVLLPVMTSAYETPHGYTSTYDAKINGIYYNLYSSGDTKTAEVTYQSIDVPGNTYSDYYGDVIIPESVTYGGVTYIVTSIGDHAFWDCTGLASIAIPNTVTSIGSGAITDCYATITIPNSVTSIGQGALPLTWYENQPDGLVYAGKVLYGYKGTMPEGTSIDIEEGTLGIAGGAFEDCNGLTSVIIPKSVVSIGHGIFSGCRVKSIVVKEGNPYLDSRDNCNAIIETATNSLVAGSYNSVIPHGVKSIRNGAFMRSGLESVTIPNSVTEIGEDAFNYCILSSVTIPNSVTTIGDNAFSFCGLLNSLTIPNSVTSIGKHAFTYSGLTSITIPNSVTSIGSYAFDTCNGLTSVTIPSSVTSIGENPFYMCINLTSIVVEGSNPNYDSRNNCNAIIETKSNKLISGCKNTIFPTDVTAIGNWAFYSQSELTSVTFPNGLVSIGHASFGNCSNLTSVTIPNSVTEISQDAFWGCDNLKSVYISDLDAWNKITFHAGLSNPLTYAHHLFLNGEEIKDLVIPNSWTSIGEFAFEGCSGLTSITIPNSVTIIGCEAFRGCSGLTSVTIGRNVNLIDIFAFYGCESLKDVYCYAERVPISYEPFYHFDQSDIAQATLHVPEGCVDAYKADEAWRYFKNIVEMGPVEVESIKISSAQQVPYCGGKNLDFTDKPELKAYVATGYDKAKGTIWLTRVKQVPAKTGFLLVGEAGDYEIPVVDEAADCYYKNMFKGTISGEAIYTTDGDYTNYYLSDGDYGVGFYKVGSSVALKANRAYLSIPTDIPTAGSEGDAEMIKVSAAKQVPYFTSKNLDFSTMDAQGVKAYTATGYNYKTGTIWLTRVKKVPAHTGVLVMAGEAGEYSVPTASVASIYENMFAGSETAQTIYTNETVDGIDYVNYYLSNGEAGVGFYKVTNSAGQSLGANRCYLQVPYRTSSGARGMFAGGRGDGSEGASSFSKIILSDNDDDVIAIPVFGGMGGDDTTRIDAIGNESVQPDVFYNLQGQRVEKPEKGIYIRNGKKVIVK